MKYVAFLRGINVGGRVTIKMSELKKLFEAAGLTEVKTLLNSGNVLFESDQKNPDVITEKLEAMLQKKYKRDITVFVRTMSELQHMAALQPFKGVAVTPNTRRYVTFLYEYSRGVKLPELPPYLKITRIKDAEVFTVLELAEYRDTTDAMKALDKALGTKITMRNWNTIERILKA